MGASYCGHLGLVVDGTNQRLVPQYRDGVSHFRHGGEGSHWLKLIVHSPEANPIPTKIIQTNTQTETGEMVAALQGRMSNFFY